MERRTNLVGIIDLCIDLEQKARDVYGEMAQGAGDRELSRLWSQMSRDECVHLAYWQRLREMAVVGGLPEVFDDPEEVEGEFRALMPKVDLLVDRMRAEPTPAKALMLALRLEFYLMHPRFQSLFHSLRDIPEQSPHEDYEIHLKQLVTVLERYGEGVPEIEFLGEMIGRIWEINREAIHQAMTDHLTGTYNRRGLFAAMKPMIYLARRNRHAVGLMMADIDNFKAINDTYGHPVGDRVIVAVANRIRSRLRASDVLGRFGGEEFLILLTPVDPEHLIRIGEEIRRDVEENTEGDLRVTLSIGATNSTIGTDVENELQRLIAQADQALYEAKRSGKNRVVLHSQPP